MASRRRTTKLYRGFLSVVRLHRAYNFHRMINQGFYRLNEFHSVVECGVKLESSFIFPLGVDIEQAWIQRRSKSMDGHAARFFA